MSYDQLTISCLGIPLEQLLDKIHAATLLGAAQGASPKVLILRGIEASTVLSWTTTVLGGCDVAPCVVATDVALKVSNVSRSVA